MTDSDRDPLELAVELALGVRQADEPERRPLSLLVAAAAIQLARGFAEPRAYYVRQEADRLAGRLAELEADRPAPDFTDDERAAGAQLWALAHARAGAGMEEATRALWLDPVEALGADDSEIWLAAPQAVRAWLERRYGPRIQRALDDVCDERSRPRRAAQFTTTEGKAP